MSKCPYCGEELMKFPSRKTKCPYCGKFIYVRTKPATNQRILIRDDQIEQIEQEWQSYLSVRDFRDYIKSQYGSDFDKRYSNFKNELNEKFTSKPSEADIVWGLSNLLLSEFMKKGDWHEMKMIYFNQAKFLYDDGKDFLRILQQVARCELMDHKKQGFVKEVEIVTCGENSCSSCRKLSGKKFTIEQALKQMPIPEKDCTHEINLKSKKGWCRCCYAPVVE